MLYMSWLPYFLLGFFIKNVANLYGNDTPNSVYYAMLPV